MALRIGAHTYTVIAEAPVGVPARWSLAMVCALATLAAGPGPARAEPPLPTPCTACPGSGGFVKSGAAGYVVGGTTGTVTQRSDRVILNWQDFNIAAGHTVEFRQPSSSAAALNRIHQASPSRILGALTANGQVYLVNPNGIVFARGANVDTRALVASALDVSDDIFNDVGIAGAINLGDNVGASRPAFEGQPGTGAVIRVEEGATLKGSERVLLIAPEVENRGSISTPDGQAVLAASKDKVYVALDRDLRGLLVEVDTGGSVSNLGEIVAERGNATLVGLAVNQSGRVRATTSVTVNGTVRLLARDGANPNLFVQGNDGSRRPVATRSGTLVLKEGSSTEALPETTSSEVAVDAQDQPLSMVELMARQVEVLGGASIVAPGGRVSITATSRPDQPLNGSDRSASLLIARGSRIDVSGDRSSVVPMERNQASLKLFGNELADAPLQRDGPLARKEITVDLRTGTPLTDIKRLREDVRRSVAERSSAGGEVVLAAEGDAILQPGSVIDVSGGQVRYLDGHLATTKLVATDGRVIDISEADPDIEYAGIFGETPPVTTKFGVSEPAPTAGDRVFHAGYVEGRDAGSLTVSARNVLLNGDVHATGTAGALQRLPESAGEAGFRRAYNEIPLGGLLSLSRTANVGDGAPNIRFGMQRDTRSFDLGTPLPEDLPLYIPVELLQSAGINRLQASASGLAVLGDDVSLKLAPGGAVSVSANSVQIDGDIELRGGSVRFSARSDGATPGEITVSSTATIDTRGVWVNDALAVRRGQVAGDALWLDGGSVSLEAQGDLTLAPGSLIDVSAGARARTNGRIEGGNAGTIQLTSRLPRLTTPTELVLGGELRGYGFEQGGTLGLTASSFRIASTFEGAASLGQVNLAPARFASGGFANFTLATDRGHIRVDDGTRVELLPQTLRVGADYVEQASGAELGGFSQVGLLPREQRPATSLSLALSRASGVGDAQASLRIGDGAIIDTGFDGQITLAADSDLYIGGALLAPSGSIRAVLNNPGSVNELGFRASQALRLGPAARLDVAGIARVTVDAAGRRTGEVLAGGDVLLQARRGYLVAAPGSVIDVSGAQTPLDLVTPGTGRLESTTVASDAGRIRLVAAEGALLAGEVRGRAGGEGAAEGELRVELNSLQRDPYGTADNPQLSGITPFPVEPRQVLVGGEFTGYYPAGVAIPANLNGRAFVDAAEVTRGGFGVVELAAQPMLQTSAAGTVVFNDDVVLEATRRVVLDAGVIGSIGRAARVAAPYVAIGPSNTQFRGLATPQPGNGRLGVEAEQIDLLGNLVLSGFAIGGTQPAVHFASSGDIRLIGTRFVGDAARTLTGSLTSLSDLKLSAAQVYPATLTDYAIDVTANGGRLVIEPAGAAVAPLSAAGAVRLKADTIVQGGVLRAPFGRIELAAGSRLELAPGSVTSTSGDGLDVPFGRTEFGETWVYSLGDVTRLQDGAPAKTVVLDAPNVVLERGALVDVSGGGDLRAYEFIKGPGGSRDILAGDNPEGAFAILPTRTNRYGVYDPLESPSAAIEPGSTIVLADGSGVPAGEYAVLPARYALVPGAYLVTAVAGFDDIRPGDPLRLPGGVTAVVAGKRSVAGTEVRSARWSAFTVEDGAQVRRRAEYDESLASEFFTDPASALPRDAGTLVIEAEQAVRIDGSLAAGTDGGRAALVEFVARELAVVKARSGSTTRVELVDSELRNVAAAGLVLGAVRETTGEVTRLDVRARSVTVESGTELVVPELVIAATDEIRVGATRLSARGTALSDGAAQYTVSGDGAVLRLAAGEQISIERDAAPGNTGSIAISRDAVLEADGSINLDASRDLVVAGTLGIEGGALSLTASQVSLGGAPAGSRGLVLSNTDLARFEASELVLRSHSTIDLYGAVKGEAEVLRLDASGLRGFASRGTRAELSASQLALTNSGATATAATGSGAGLLRLAAQSLSVEHGTVELSGFAGVELVARREFIGRGTAGLNVHGELVLDTPLITAGPAADLTITADGRLTTQGAVSTADTQPMTALGADLRLTAAGIVHGTRIELPSGVVTLQATGPVGLELGRTAVIDVGSRSVDFHGPVIGSPGGEVWLIADRGDLRLLDGATVDVAGGAARGDAGQLSMSAAAGALDIASGARLRGSATDTKRSGRVEIAAGALTGGFSSLNGILNAGGFRDRRAIALGSGNVTVAAGDRVQVREFELSADGGALEVAGAIDASAAEGGTVRLAARDELRLRGTARIVARATADAAAGGQVELTTRDGRIVVEATSAPGAASIDVSGRDADGLPSDDGRVMLRAARIGDSGVNVAPIAGRIAGTERVDVEAVRVYSATSIDAVLIGQVRSDTDAYMTRAASIERGINTAGNPGARLLPGVEIASSGDLMLNSEWNLADWRYAGNAGVLTLRAAGDLALSHALSDGVVFDTADPQLPARELVQRGASWSYRLVSGASRGADPLGVTAGRGSVTVGDGVRVRTGTGDISVAAGGDVVLASRSSAVYTMGENRGTGALSTLDVEALLRGDFVDRGGDLRVRAFGDVRGVSDRPLPDWQPRAAGEFEVYAPGVVFPAAWAIDVSRFEQGFGALGGGHVGVRAGGQLESLTVAVPTNGLPYAKDGSDTRVAGGGTISLEAGGDIRGGVYSIGAGTATIRAGGAVTAASGAPIELAVLQLGDAGIAVQGRRGVTIGTVFNPTLTDPDPQQGLTQLTEVPIPSYFFTYGEHSSVDLSATAGDIVLRASANSLAGLYQDRQVDPQLLAMFPGRLTARSLQHDVVIADRIEMYPSRVGTLELLAGRDLRAAGAGYISMSDADPGLLPTVAQPVSVLNAFVLRDLLAKHAAAPLHAGDDRPALLVARTGAVGADGQDALGFSIAKAARVYAGQDVRNLTLNTQHVRAGDLTEIEAGRDIVYTTLRRPDGAIATNTGRIDIAGPGRVDLLAGRDIDFGSAVGIGTRGDLTNPGLDDRGADVNLWTGRATPADFAGFSDRYLGAGGEYSDELAQFLVAYPDVPGRSDLEQFKALPEREQRDFIRQVFFSEIKQGGLEDTERGYAAIAALYPADEDGAYVGDLQSFLSTISTLDGGTINILVPGGLVNAGVASSGSISKTPAELGVVVQREGDINAFVRDDFLVNASRVFALDGGDVLIWSSDADIDAGRGARSALSIPPPTITFDAQGNVIVEFPPAISGSGIRTAVTTPGREPGDVFLFAPSGVVDAGDAGIQSAGNITVVATQVIGADNISAGGIAVGVPVDTGGLGASLAGVSSAASSATNAAAVAAGEAAQSPTDGESMADTALSWLEVFVLGLGEEQCNPRDLECLKRQKKATP